MALMRNGSVTDIYRKNNFIDKFVPKNTTAKITIKNFKINLLIQIMQEKAGFKNRNSLLL
jgi:hypothetical protein